MRSVRGILKGLLQGAGNGEAVGVHAERSEVAGGGEHDGDRIADGDVGDAAEFVDDDYFELRGAVDLGDDAVELVIGSLGNVVVQFDFLGKERA